MKTKLHLRYSLLDYKDAAIFVIYKYIIARAKLTKHDTSKYIYKNVLAKINAQDTKPIKQKALRTKRINLTIGSIATPFQIYIPTSLQH